MSCRRQLIDVALSHLNGSLSLINKSIVFKSRPLVATPQVISVLEPVQDLACHVPAGL